jgi:hypothetical protein
VWTIPDGRQHIIPGDLAEQELALKNTYYALITVALGTQAFIAMGILLCYWRELELIYGRSEGFLLSVLPSSNKSDGEEMELFENRTRTDGSEERSDSFDGPGAVSQPLIARTPSDITLSRGPWMEQGGPSRARQNPNFLSGQNQASASGVSIISDSPTG